MEAASGSFPPSAPQPCHRDSSTDGAPPNDDLPATSITLIGTTRIASGCRSDVYVADFRPPVGSGGTATGATTRVALKVATVPTADGPGAAAEAALSDALLRKEAALYRTLRHPALLGCAGALTLANGRRALVLEFAGGGTLGAARDRAAAAGSLLPPRFAVAALRDVAAALAYLHAAGYVHGDVHVGNVLLTGAVDGGGAGGGGGGGGGGGTAAAATPVARLADLGTVRDVRRAGDGVYFPVPGVAAWPAARAPPGPAHTAPEALRDGSCAAPADVWSWGVLAAEIVGGRSPWGGLDPAARGDRAVLRRQLLDGAAVPWPPGGRGGGPFGPLMALGRAATRRQAEERPTAGELLASLDALLATL